MPVSHPRSDPRRATLFAITAKRALRNTWLRAPAFKSFARVLGAASLALVSLSNASAQSNVRQGVISKIELTEAGNFGFRVRLSQGSTDSLADCVDRFAYIEPAHSNYAAITAMLMSDYIEKRHLLMFIDKEARGYCRITYISN